MGIASPGPKQPDPRGGSYTLPETRQCAALGKFVTRIRLFWIVSRPNCIELLDFTVVADTGTFMGILRRIDRRHEPRKQADLALLVWGVDTKGERFMQEARARDISLSGALISGLDGDLRPGDVVGILYAGKKARFRVVWIRYDGTGDKMQVALHRMEGDECPWKGLLQESEAKPVAAPLEEH
jgi:hypothetical protein